MDSLPIVLVPGLLCSPRLYLEQLPELWRFGPVTIADHTRDDTMGEIARRLLDAAPPRFALAGLSMGGYLAFEVLRQAPERVARLALLDTAAQPDTPEISERRRSQVAMARDGRLAEVVDQLMPVLLHPNHRDDPRLRAVAHQMARETGPEAFARQEAAIIERPDSHPDLGGIRCPTLVLVGEADALTPPERSMEMAEGIPGARLVTVAGAGHLSTIERPEAVTRALVEWLSA